MDLYRFKAGRVPLLVSIPHLGTHIPEDLRRPMTVAARRVADTDWHLDLLYTFLDEIGASSLMATHSRYVIDLNRPPDDINLYPGQDTTSLCPIDTGNREQVYSPGCEPTPEEIAERTERYWKPYHAKLAEELARLKAKHGYALLWEAHSIPSVLPRFFEGRLWDFNLGTNRGAACRPGVGEKLLAVASKAKGYSAVLDRRFVGGYITRHYGRPAEGVQAVQLELTRCTYMDEADPTFSFRESLARKVRPHVRALVETYLEVARPA